MFKATNNKETNNKATNNKETNNKATNNISFISNDEISILVNKVLAQTNYTEEIAKTKLQEFNYDLMRVLKDYMGIPEKKTDSGTKIKSINQEIYKQIRHTLDSSMREYREKNPVNIEQVVTNLSESEENEKNKLLIERLKNELNSLSISNKDISNKDISIIN